MDFDSNGLSGKWLNIKTGKTVFVTNTVMDEFNNMIFITNEGSIPGNIFSSDYIKDDGEEVNNSTNSSSIETHEVASTEDSLLIDDYSIDYIENNDSQSSPKQIQSSGVSKEKNIIDNIFSKITTQPQIKISIDWKEFPYNDIKTIISYLDIDMKDISDYIIENYVSTEMINNAISSFLNKFMNKSKNEKS